MWKGESVIKRMAEGLLSAELFEQTQAYLLRTGEDGRSVYDQLCLLFEKLLKDGEELVGATPFSA